MDVIRVVVGVAMSHDLAPPGPPKHAIVPVAVKDKPSSALKKRRP
jgi:hypothetical protein